MTFYLKYRPQKLEELDLESVRKSLKKIVESEKIPHAFLFSGPKGTGKTSAARILAKAVNCESPDKKTGEPCNICDQCKTIAKGENLDVIELDAASHRGIDDVRTLRDAVKLSPARAKRKVYIIDEAHMLTTEASNALLKTLEEPPEHVMFVLATTNPEKLIGTIRSRATSLMFTRAKTNEIVRSLKRVVKGEKIDYEKEALELIAEVSDGSFRDAVKTLEQLLSEGVKIKKEKVEEFLFEKGAFDAKKLIEALVNKETKTALSMIEKAVSQGVSSRVVAESVIGLLRSGLMAEVGVKGEEIEGLEREELVSLIKLFTEASGQIQKSFIEQVPLEIAVVEWCESTGSSGNGESPKKANGRKGQNGRKDAGSNGSKKASSNGAEEKNLAINGEMTKEAWTLLLKKIRPKNASTEALLRAAKPVDYDGETLTLGVFYSFHKEKLEGNPHRMLIEDTAASVIGEKVRIVCTLTEPPKKKEKDDESVNNKDSSKEEEVVLTEGEDEDIVRVAKEIFGN